MRRSVSPVRVARPLLVHLLLLLLVLLSLSLSHVVVVRAAAPRPLLPSPLRSVLSSAGAPIPLQRVSVYVHPDGSVQWKRDVWDVSGATALVSVEDAMNETGWIVVRIQTNSAFDDMQQAYAAGFGEALLTAERIWHVYADLAYETLDEPANSTALPAKLVAWFDANRAWVRGKCAEHAGTGQDHYWDAVCAVHEQFEGMVAGYTEVAASLGLPALTYAHLQVVNSIGDTWSLLVGLGIQALPDFAHMTPAQVSRWMGKHGHCSGLVRVTPDFGDLMLSHATWESYVSMVRVYRIVDMQFRNPLVKARRMSYSSYPATVTSNDDFFVMPDTGLGVFETSNDVFNDSVLTQHTSPEVFLNYIPAVLACRVADNGSDWAKYFLRHNGNLYTNQFMVVDFKRFTPFQPLVDGVLTVVENIPGYATWADRTQDGLGHGSWPSYNIPYFDTIWEMSGYPKVAKKQPHATWSFAPRAQIFRRDAHAVVDLPSLGRLMRYNDFESDPLSNGEPGEAIAARYDLEPVLADRDPSGAIDTKMINWQMMRSGGDVLMRAGPTDDQQPVFEWDAFEREMGKHYVHLGVPNRLQFDWLRLGWDTTARSARVEDLVW